MLDMKSAGSGALAEEAESSQASGLLWSLLPSESEDSAVGLGSGFRGSASASHRPWAEGGGKLFNTAACPLYWGPLCFQMCIQEAVGRVQCHGPTLSSFTIRVTICLWQSPVYPDSKQLERPNYQMLHFSFFIIKHPTLCFWKPLTRKEGKHLGFMEADSFVVMADDAGSRAQRFTVLSVCSHTFSSLPSCQLCSAHLVAGPWEQT